MNRPRTIKRDPFGNILLPRMYYKHGAYYLVTPQNKWLRLADNFTEAVRAYSTSTTVHEHGSMVALVVAWKADKLPTYAANTQADYGRMCDAITESLADFMVDQILPSDVYEFCSQWKDKPRTAKAYRALLSMIFVFGASMGWPNDNPAARSLTFKQKPKRDRYITDEEIKKIKEGALTAKDGIANPSGKMIECFIDLAYATAQRVGDLLALRWQDVTDQGIYFHPSKTVNSTGVKMLVEMTPDLAGIIDRCRNFGKVKGMTVIHTLDGQPYTYSGIQSAWRRACARAKVKAHIHDIRAKALTDIAEAKDAQKLAGHATEGMTAHYRKARSVEKVKPVPAK